MSGNLELVLTGDCLELMRCLGDDSVDLILGSPPYEDKRAYGDLNFRFTGQVWVDWMFQRWVEMNRICRGLVVMVVEGRTSKFRWSATPALLMADLHRAGMKLRKPPVFHRQGIPGGGGTDFWRNDYEFCVCTSKGKLPFSDNKATGWKCKYPRGGDLSHRRADGSRVPKGRQGRPEITNPGNVIHCKVGKGHMGSLLAHENEAPFPESLVEPFVKCFSPPGGVVLDPFGGSGTVASVCKRLGRGFISIDIRECQSALTEARLKEREPLEAIHG